MLSLHMMRQWEKPLEERVQSGRALGGLKINAIDTQEKLIHFVVPREDFAFFTEQQQLRLSQNDPVGNYFPVNFFGLTPKGLTVSCNATSDLVFEGRAADWCLDEDLVDVSPYYLKAIQALGDEAHGRDNVFPTLFGEVDSNIHGETYDEAMDFLESNEVGLNESQIDAVATALAASPFHLVQGPPGTGKTMTLARLVERLVAEGHRVLVSGFTHRSIHQALQKIQQTIARNHPDCPVVKISAPVGDGLPFPVFEDLVSSNLANHDGPYVIGATPFALFTGRLETACFDSAVLDETSQLTVPAAIMAMMRSDRWFFFGDHQQLPPVSLVHRDDPTAASIFSHLTRQLTPTTLSTTYRLNEPLCHWPSEQFYSGHLRSAVPDGRLAFRKQPTARYAEILSPEHSLVHVPVDFPDAKSRNDEEADICADLILALLESGIRHEEIGVVTPFRAQASRIRTLLKGVRFSAFPETERLITVDTVERFQGQEREVILYSFAASDLDFLSLEPIQNFLFQPERLNVAVTRARTKVILLHSPELLALAEESSFYDESAAVFKSLVDYAHTCTV